MNNEDIETETPARNDSKSVLDSGDVLRSNARWRVKFVFVLGPFILFSNQISLFGIIFVARIALFPTLGKELDILISIILFVSLNISYRTKALWVGVLELWLGRKLFRASDSNWHTLKLKRRKSSKKVYFFAVFLA